MIGEPAREKDTYRAYHAFRALLFGTNIPPDGLSGNGDLVRLVRLVRFLRTFLHKNKQDAGESAGTTAKLLN
jgi:hypothetical protein